MNPADTSFDTYAYFVKSRAKKLLTAEMDMLHAAVGCATEAGEFLDTMKKIWVYSQKFEDLNKEGKTHLENIQEELGDMLFYIQAAANVIGLNIEDLILQNIAKLSKRYPNGYSDSAAKERADKIESEGNVGSGGTSAGSQ